MERWLGYLAGVIDSEGTIHVNYNRYKDRIFYFKVFTAIGNESPLLIERCILIIREAGVEVPKGTPYVLKTKSGNKFYKVTISNQEENYKLCKVIKGYLVSKKELCELALEFLSSRKEKRRARDGSGRFTFSPYSDEELSILREIYTLNRRGKRKRLGEGYLIELQKKNEQRKRVI